MEAMSHKSDDFPVAPNGEVSYSILKHTTQRVCLVYCGCEKWLRQPLGFSYVFCSRR